MSQTVTQNKVSKLQLINRTPGQISTGANTKVLLDGQPLNGVSFIKIECKARGVTKVLIEMLADVEIDQDVELHKTGEQEPSPGAKYVLSKLETVVVIPKKDDNR